MVVKIVSVLPMAQRAYTDRQGRADVFKTKGFVLMHSTGEFYVEAIQKDAEALDAMDIKSGDIAFVSFRVACRSYKTAQGETRYSNEITLSNMVLV